MHPVPLLHIFRTYSELIQDGLVVSVSPLMQKVVGSGPGQVIPKIIIKTVQTASLLGKHTCSPTV